MYNRYIRDDKGVYTRISQEEPSRQQSPPQREPPPEAPPLRETPRREAYREAPEKTRVPPRREEPSGGGRSNRPSGGVSDGLTGFLRHFLDQFHLEHVDTGDLLLLGLLFFLFREDADEELLMALGLLLIL